jgi:hypothetical protein
MPTQRLQALFCRLRSQTGGYLGHSSDATEASKLLELAGDIGNVCPDIRGSVCCVAQLVGLLVPCANGACRRRPDLEQ